MKSVVKNRADLVQIKSATQAMHQKRQMSGTHTTRLLEDVNASEMSGRHAMRFLEHPKWVRNVERDVNPQRGGIAAKRDNRGALCDPDLDNYWLEVVT